MSRYNLPEFPGFQDVFGVQLASAGRRCCIELAPDLTERMAATAKPHTVLAEALTGALFALHNMRDSFDVVLILLSQEWEAGFRATEGEDFDLRGYPCMRGTNLELGPQEVLLWTQGNLPQVAGGKDYYKEGKGIPEPLLLVRHAGLGSMADLCRETLALTKMDWNNDGPYDRLPVTLSFAGTLAQIVKRMPRLEARPYPVRLFM